MWPEFTRMIYTVQSASRNIAAGRRNFIIFLFLNRTLSSPVRF